ncbi:MAG TPA: hypothetical protein VFZ21_09980 [Gemmatimonadaceae bacterium]|nr:hypothetical protein [Gemmatimonadaceae bacterium]
MPRPIFTAMAAAALFAAPRVATAQYESARSPNAGHEAHAASTSLRTTLNTLLQEHVYLASAATGAALGKRPAEFKAAADALDQNSQQLSAAVGSVYGTDAGKSFLALWRKHIAIVVDYTTAVAKKDQAGSDKAVAELIGYTQAFAAFLSGANPHLPKATVADLVKTHILTLKDVIDAQASGNAATSYAALRTAAGHMQMIADPLADAIGKQFPNKYGN